MRLCLLIILVPMIVACGDATQDNDEQLACIERTMDAAYAYTGEFLNFSEALEAWAQAEQVYLANKNDDAAIATAGDALNNMISTIAASLVSVKNTEAPTCLLNFKDEWPDLVYLMNHVMEYQNSVIDMMDSIDECYERDDSACAKAIFPSKLAAVHSSMDNITDFADCERSPECIHAKATQQ